MIDRRIFSHIDWLTVSTTLLLTIIGISTIYSATYLHNPIIYQKQIFWFIISVSLLIPLVIIDYIYIDRFAYFIYFALIIVLIATLLVGLKVGGARRWMDLGFIVFQPSEFSKLALIIVLGKYFGERQITRGGLSFTDLIVPLGLLSLPFILILKQPDLGTALLHFIIFTSIVLAIGLRTETLIISSGIIALLVPIGWFNLKAYQKARLISFLDPAGDPYGSGYHLLQSKIAIGSGGFFGKGFTKGTQGSLEFLPEHHTDFIFAIFAEEFGAVGTLVLFILFVTLIMAGINTARTAKDKFAFIVAIGVTSMLFWHFVINIGMVTGLLPVVGVPLPFLSYGGSFLLTTIASIGILLNINMRRFTY